MARTATIQGVLFETDVPELVVASDAVGTVYVALLVERRKQGDRFLCVPVSIRRLADLEKGMIDLRDALLRNETGEAYSADFAVVESQPTLSLAALSGIPENWLPKPGFLLSDFLSDVEDDLALLHAEAQHRHTSVGVLVLSPPEALDVAKIDSYHLADGVRLFQNFVRFAYGKAMAGGSGLSRAMMGSEDAYVFQIFPQFSHGSFRVHFQSKWNADTSGTTGVGVALAKADEITEHVDNPELALPILRKNRGHVIAAYEALLRFVAFEKVPLSYGWSEPGAHAPSRRKIGVDSAQRLYDILRERQELSAVEVQLIGVFTKLNTDGTWLLRAGKRTIKGETAEGVGDLLAGVVFETQQYRLVCDERLDEVVGTGRQKTRYVLKQKPIAV